MLVCARCNENLNETNDLKLVPKKPKDGWSLESKECDLEHIPYHKWCWELVKLGRLIADVGISKYKKIIKAFEDGVGDWEYQHED